MTKKIELTVVQNFSSDEFSELITNLVRNQIDHYLKNQQTENREKYLTRDQITEEFDISLTCVNDWCKKGILKKLKLGNRTYFKWSDVVEKLNNSNLG